MPDERGTEGTQLISYAAIRYARLLALIIILFFISRHLFLYPTLFMEINV